MKHTIFLLLLLSTAACKQPESSNIGIIERIDPALDALIEPDATVEKLADGFKWSEGPLWLESEKMLIFSDVPANTIYKWTEEKGKEVYLKPSGYTGINSPYSGEEGSNGLTLTNDGKLVLCQHGDRRISVMDAPLGSPISKFRPLADNYEGKKFNSPNDAVISKSGTLFFTDPPYGLPNKESDSTKEIPFHGVFKSKDGKVTLLTDSVTRPNGIALFPGDKRLIVANSDPDKAVWYTFDLSDKDSITRGSLFYDATAIGKTEKGSPDGLKIDAQGNVFASGPGGIWIFNSEGKVLGKIKLTEPTANCAFSADGKTLYITSNMNLLRLKMRS
ncbi:MAG: SMP-30/gluconolactonase/LRE family protein [Chryseolinea sp.]